MEFGGKFAYLNYSSGEESCEEDEVSAPLEATLTFGAPISSAMRESHHPSPFGAPSSVSPFGAPSSVSPFGAPSSVSPFGAPQSAAPSVSPFVASCAAPSVSPFGAPQSAAPSVSPFGASSVAPSVSPFGASCVAPSASPFGAPLSAAAPQSESVQPPLMQRMRAALSMSRSNAPSQQQPAGSSVGVENPFAPAVPCGTAVAPSPFGPPQAGPQAQTSSKQKKRVVFKKSIPNVFLVKLGTLGDDVAFSTGDATICQKCSAVMNIHSKCPITPTEESPSRRLWICEFCAHENELFIDEEEIPKDESLDYIIQPPPMRGVAELSSNIVFCAGTLTVGYGKLSTWKKEVDLENAKT